VALKGLFCNAGDRVFRVSHAVLARPE